MTPEQMAKNAAEAIQAGTKMTLTRQRGAKMPPKFPRGEFLCENFDGRNVYFYDPVKVLAWLAANGLVKVSPSVGAIKSTAKAKGMHKAEGEGK